MANFAHGPLDFGPMPLAPPVMRPDTFQSLGRALLDAHRGFDAVLGERMRQIASASATNLDADYNDSVGPALNDLGALDRTIDFDKPLEIVANCDAAESRLLAILGDLPDPNATDPSIDPPPPDADPGAGRDLHAAPAPPVVGRPAPAPPSDPIGPDALHDLVVKRFTAFAGHAPTDAQLQALADDFGYVQGTFVSQAAVVAYLNSARARQVVGLG
jgi:hypothetical protein